MSHDDTARWLGAALRSARRTRGWTQEDLAERAGVSVDTVARLEQAKFSPTLGVLSKIARGLNIELATLWEGLGPQRPERVGLDGLTDPERKFIVALVQLFAARHDPRNRLP